ncbi:MAG: cysteine--tRNA ligase [Pirellulales bacterium]|nr:cysteine--tRNA ligase [Pirellulales bacterium]
MPIRLYNTLTRTKEPFEPVQPGKVGIYLCGPTVYKPSHIGHMVGPVIFDTIKRYLQWNGYQVTLVVNITDVDDKLIAESQVRGISMAALAEEMTADYMRNLAAVGVDTVDHFPRATAHIDEIVAFVSELIARGYAYVADGDVYFDVSRDPEYGKLSRRSVEEMQGEGGTTAERKRSAADFALWKSAKPDEPSWPSPWGPGRPGWHIECSAMSRKLLGRTFDIHGGGLDLVFPHHENEIAQSECCHGVPQAKYWLHNGLMQASDEVGKIGGRHTRRAEPQPGDQQAQEAGKMGKSKGAAPFSELLKTYSGETIRFFLLSTHYRRPIDFSEERIREVERGLEKFYGLFARYQRVTQKSFYDLPATRRREDGQFEPGQDPFLLEVHTCRERVLENMDDDFNTGGAIGVLFDLVRLLNRYCDEHGLESAPQPQTVAVWERGMFTLRELTATLGLFRAPPQATHAARDELVPRLLDLLVSVRAEARAARNFAAADRIRQGLAELGITLEDRPGGTVWVLPK